MSRQSRDLRHANERRGERERERERERDRRLVFIWFSVLQFFIDSETSRVCAPETDICGYLERCKLLSYRANCRERSSSAGSDVDLTSFVRPIRAADLMSNAD